jgi:hypothetical protein
MRFRLMFLSRASDGKLIEDLSGRTGDGGGAWRCEPYPNRRAAAPGQRYGMSTQLFKWKALSGAVQG